MVGTPLDKIFRNLAIERTNNMSNYDWLWNEYRRVAAKSAVEQGSEYKPLIVFNRRGPSGVLPSLVQPNLPWKIVSDDEVLVTVPSIRDVTGGGLAKRLKVLETRLELITQGEPVLADPFYENLTKSFSNIDWTDMSLPFGRVQVLGWFCQNLDEYIVSPGWEVGHILMKNERQLGREICKLAGVSLDHWGKARDHYYQECASTPEYIVSSFLEKMNSA
jgi:hypothetical protein